MCLPHILQVIRISEISKHYMYLPVGTQWKLAKVLVVLVAEHPSAQRVTGRLVAHCDFSWLIRIGFSFLTVVCRSLQSIREQHRFLLSLLKETRSSTASFPKVAFIKASCSCLLALKVCDLNEFIPNNLFYRYTMINFGAILIPSSHRLLFPEPL